MQLLKNPGALYIGGEWVNVDGREAVINPADESLIAEAPVGDATHVDAAVAAAYEAFTNGPWPRMSAQERQKILGAFLDAIERRKDWLIDLITAEAGSIISNSRGLLYGITMKHARHTLSIMTRPAQTPLQIELTPAADGTTVMGSSLISREPVGVVAAITPYNAPFLVNLGKIFPAMAVGCTVVLKPSNYTPFEALFLGEIADEVGLPKGVLNVVNGGVDVGTALTTDRRVDLVSFTGSDAVGAAIQAQTAPTLKRLLMELGGKSALIVRPDADLNLAAASGVGGFTVQCGQGCALLTRHIVHNSIRAEYVQKLKQIAEAVKVGSPTDPSTQMGPLIRDAARARTERYVDIALSEGARLVTGGKRPDGLDRGFYYTPTLFDNVENSFRIAQEEVFGPIGVVVGYDTDEEAIRLANDSDFGLGGGVFSRDTGKAYQMALQIRAGGVTINGGAGTMTSDAPFGGIKRSGYGREYGMMGLDEFTYAKTIAYRAF